jgi:hypothetical protein
VRVGFYRDEEIVLILEEFMNARKINNFLFNGKKR